MESGSVLQSCTPRDAHMKGLRKVCTCPTITRSFINFYHAIWKDGRKKQIGAKATTTKHKGKCKQIFTFRSNVNDINHKLEAPELFLERLEICGSHRADRRAEKEINFVNGQAQNFG